MHKDEKDLKDVMKSEVRRGRRPVNMEGQQEHDERRAAVTKALRLATEEEFLSAMRAYGLGQEEIETVLAVWREYRS